MGGANKGLTEGEIIIGLARALECMKLCGILPKHKVLDNEASRAYKDAIRESIMTYQLVPPDGHQRSIEEK